jgi:hypothetical protein
LGSATIQLPEEEAVLLTVHKPQAKIEHSHNLDVSLS